MWNDRLRVTRLRGLLLATEAMTCAASLGDLIEIVRTTARRLVGSDGIALVLREGDYCHYVEEDAIGPLWKGQRFLAEACVSGWAMIHQATAIVPDIQTDARIPYTLYRDTFVRSMVMAPILADGPSGAIGAYWSEAHQPSEDAVTVVETMARFAGLAVTRVHRLARLSPPDAAAQFG